MSETVREEEVVQEATTTPPKPTKAHGRIATLLGAAVTAATMLSCSPSTPKQPTTPPPRARKCTPGGCAFPKAASPGNKPRRMKLLPMPGEAPKAKRRRGELEPAPIN